MLTMFHIGFVTMDASYVPHIYDPDLRLSLRKLSTFWYNIVLGLAVPEFLETDDVDMECNNKTTSGPLKLHGLYRDAFLFMRLLNPWKYIYIILVLVKKCSKC